MIKITVAQVTTRDLSGIGKTSGKPYAMRIQTGYAHTLDKDGNAPPYPEKFEIVLDKDAAPYAPGDYTLSPSAVYVNKDGRLSCTPRLTPIKRAA